MATARTWLVGAALAALTMAQAASAATPGAMAGFTPDHAKAQRELEAAYDTAIDPAEMQAWLCLLYTSPSPRD